MSNETVIKRFPFERLEGIDSITKSRVSFQGNPRRFGHKKATIMLAASGILSEEYPMTVRQVYYRLYSQGWITNSQASYDLVGGALVAARQIGLIEWHKIEDRVRKPRHVSMWDDLENFLEAVKQSYKRDVWKDQDNYIEIWLEKDALSGIVEDECAKNGVTLNVARGYDGWSSIYYAQERFKEIEADGKNITILYLGDYDPSGLQMEVSLSERFSWFGLYPDIHRIGITYEDIKQYNLPEEPGKRSDSRYDWMERTFGHAIQVELDALPVNVLRQRITDEIDKRLDGDLLEEVEEEEEEEVTLLSRIIENRDLLDTSAPVAVAGPVANSLQEILEHYLEEISKPSKGKPTPNKRLYHIERAQAALKAWEEWEEEHEASK